MPCEDCEKLRDEVSLCRRWLLQEEAEHDKLKETLRETLEHEAEVMATCGEAHDLIRRLAEICDHGPGRGWTDEKGEWSYTEYIEKRGAALANARAILADPPKTLEHASTSRRGDCTPGRRAPTPAAVESSGDSHAAVGETDLADPPKGEGE
jgi:hypothetical protein